MTVCGEGVTPPAPVLTLALAVALVPCPCSGFGLGVCSATGCVTAVGVCVGVRTFNSAGEGVQQRNYIEESQKLSDIKAKEIGSSLAEMRNGGNDRYGMRVLYFCATFRGACEPLRVQQELTSVRLGARSHNGRRVSQR